MGPVNLSQRMTDPVQIGFARSMNEHLLTFRCIFLSQCDWTVKHFLISKRTHVQT